MNRVHNIDIEQLKNFLIEGKSTREIADIIKMSPRNVAHHVKKNNLTHLYDKPKYPAVFLDKIDTKELAYSIGFIIADGAVSNEKVEIGVAVVDACVIDFFVKTFQGKSRLNNTTDIPNRRYPRARFSRKIKGINKFIGGDKKIDRNVPILSKKLEVYLLRGIFDADGCITWGFRKDRGRLWHKVSFTSSLSIVTSVQKMLQRINISTSIRPKDSSNKCYVLDFGNKADILKFYNYLYSDTEFMPLKRKFDRYQALRLELGEFSETTKN